MDNAYQKADYTGRTVDLLLLKTVLNVPTVNQRVGIDVSNVVDEPRIVAGVEKLVQRYALLFINAIGSTKFVDGHGTNLVPNVSKGMVYNMATLEATAAEANMMASRRIIKADEGEDMPNDERLVRADVIDLQFYREKALVRISVRLTTAAGTSYVYIIPVGVGVRG